MLLERILRKISKQALDIAEPRFYDARHNKEARTFLRGLKKQNGMALKPSHRKMADDYAVEMFGSKRFAPWLYVYSVLRGEFLEGWIPDNFFGRVVCPKINKDLRLITHLKTFSNAVLRSDALPDIGYFVDGVFYDRNFSTESFQEFRDRLADLHDEVFVKKDGAGRGLGVIKLAVKDLDEERFQEFGDCAVQSPVKQHAFFDEIIPGTVATIRVTTVREPDGTFSMRSGDIRLGRKDTSWIKAGRFVAAAVLNDKGDVDAFGFTEELKRCTHHPDTGAPFANIRIPRFEDAVATCTCLHRKVPHMAIIGWDVALDQDERIRVLEWNGDHCGIRYSEARTGPCFLGLGWERYRNL